VNPLPYPATYLVVEKSRYVRPHSRLPEDQHPCFTGKIACRLAEEVAQADEFNERLDAVLRERPLMAHDVLHYPGRHIESERSRPVHEKRRGTVSLVVQPLRRGSTLLVIARRLWSDQHSPRSASVGGEDDVRVVAVFNEDADRS